MKNGSLFVKDFFIVKCFADVLNNIFHKLIFNTLPTLIKLYLFWAYRHANIKKTTFVYHGLIDIFVFFKPKKDTLNNVKKRFR